jgi:hypothetical protein
MPNPGEGAASFSYTGIYRALVIDARDPEKRGRVKVWCPDTMPEIPQDQGLWARSANNSLGGRNNIDNRLGADTSGNSSGGEHYFQGTCFIPPNGSWVYIFYEYGNVNEPRYFGMAEPGNCKVPTECQQGDEYEKKWLIMKSRQGRAIIVSDDPFDERVEITGKKRQLDPFDVSGNPESIYTIEDNQTVILLDERDGQERILIKDYKGNFFNFDIESQSLFVDMAGDIHLNAGRSMYLTAGRDMHILSERILNVESKNNSLNFKTGQAINLDAGADINVKAGANANIDALANVNVLAGINIQEDGVLLLQQQGAAKGATGAERALPASPEGVRNDPAPLSQPEEDPDPPIRQELPSTVVHTDTPEVENGTNTQR